ncbi:MAG: hypothetical protein ACI93R_003973 [Flavobacteriales bacterium]|jgi:hypothetical protein
MVWIGSFDATLSNHIKIARSALGDNGQPQGVIKTIHGRGYQFVAALHDIPQQADSSNKSKVTKKLPSVDSSSLLNRMAVVLLSTLSVAVVYLLLNSFTVEKSTSHDLKPTSVNIENRSIAILPFENLSVMENDNYFADGIHSDLLTQLSKLYDIKTIARSSVLHYRDTKKNLRTVGQELSVATILEGGVQRSAFRE